MPDALTVHVNRDRLHGLDVPDSFETSDSFDVVLVNHGESTHVHLHLDDALSAVAAIDAPNHHVEGESERRVQVTRTGAGTARGNLKAVTAYGATTRYVDVRVAEPGESKPPVEVGEELTRPTPRPDPSDASLLGDREGRVVAAGVVVVVALGVLAGAIAGSLLVALAVAALGLGGVVAATAVYRAA